MPERSSSHLRRFVIISMIILLCAVVAAGILFGVWRHLHQIPRVQTTTVQLRTMQRTIFSSGPVKPTQRQVVYLSSLPAPVKKMEISEGDHVKKGQLLIELDDSAQKSAISAAKTALAQANTSYNRVLQGYDKAPPLLKQVWLPQVDAAESAVTQAKSQLAAAQRQQASNKITANFAGLVLIATANGIDASGNQSPVLELVGNQNQIILGLSEVDATHVKKGMKATLTSDAFPNQTFHGTVSMVAPYAQTTSSGSGEVEVHINPGTKFPVPLGYQVNCKIISSTHQQVPTLPYSALVQQGTNYAVYVLQNGHVKLTSVKLGITNDTSVEVTSGLKAGQKVVDNPSAALRNGEAVKAR